ncbi:MAG: DUF4065 domain-containing protein [Saprospiraceae bacterium]|nr:DUF4065 domain-containing protein [Saprospiraceae bacterium]
MNKVTHQDISNYFISLANDSGSFISNLKLQKLLYYAQAWHLAKFKERQFEGEFQAWIHGPVLPESYQEFRQFHWKPILKDVDKNFHKQFSASLNPEHAEMLFNVVNEYFGQEGYTLEKLTHNEDPWKLARIGLSDDEPSNNIIQIDWMINYYSKYL